MLDAIGNITFGHLNSTKLSRAKVFISYSHADDKPARRLYSDLQKSGLLPWLDSESLLPGQNWKIEITKAMKNSHFFVALLSSQSVTKKGYVQKELKIALDILEEFPVGSIYIIPARLDTCEPSDERLQEIHRVDLFLDWDRGIEQILRTIDGEAKNKFTELAKTVSYTNRQQMNHNYNDYGYNMSKEFPPSPVRIISDVWTCQVCGETFPSYKAYSHHFGDAHR